MVSQCNQDRVLSYWIKNDYLDVAAFLTSSLDNLRNRGAVLKKDFDELNGGLRQLCQKVSENPDSATPNNKEISQLFKDLHYLELEIIQRICILIELLAVYHRVMRTNLRDLPKSVGSRDVETEDLHKEFAYFEKLTIHDVWRNFRYPNAENFSELTPEEQGTLSEIFQDSANITLIHFREVYQFNSNFRTLYNKYKHGLSEQTGIFGIDKERHLIESNVLVRHKVEEKHTKTTAHYTYLVPLSFDTIEYLEKVARSAWTLLQLLVENTLLSLVNEGKDFIPRTLFFEKESNKEQLSQITEKIKSCVMPNIESKILVNPPPNEADKKRIEEAIKRDHIYRMKQDILDVENLKKTFTLETNK